MKDQVTKRTEPGICIFDIEGHPCFMNQAARDFCGADLSKIPQEIKEVYEYTKRYIVAGYKRDDKNGELTRILINHAGQGYFLRSLTLQDIRNSRYYIMILVEKVRTAGVDMEDIREIYKLTSRECDVVRCLFAGLTNKEIAASLGIEVNTVKDYIKNIMHKTNITTRTGIICKIVGCNT